MARTIFWTVGYAPYNRIPRAGIFLTKMEAAAAANKLNREPGGEYKGRGCKAVRCDSTGRLLP